MPKEIPFYPHSASGPEAVIPYHEEGDDFEFSNEASDRLILGVDIGISRDVIGLKKIDEVVDKLKDSGKLTSQDIKIIEIFKEIGNDFNGVAKILREEEGVEISSKEVEKEWLRIVNEIKRAMPVERTLSPEDLVKRSETPFYEGLQAFLAENHARRKEDFDILFKKFVLEGFKDDIKQPLQNFSKKTIARYGIDPFSDIQEIEEVIDSAIEEVRKDIFDNLTKLQQENFLYFFKTGNSEEMGEMQKKMLEKQVRSVVLKIQDKVREWAVQKLISFFQNEQ